MTEPGARRPRGGWANRRGNPKPQYDFGGPLPKWHSQAPSRSVYSLVRFNCRMRGLVMKKSLITGALITGAMFGALMAGSAMAADMPVKAPIMRAPPPPVFSWTGCYIGGGGGYCLWTQETFHQTDSGHVATS